MIFHNGKEHDQNRYAALQERLGKQRIGSIGYTRYESCQKPDDAPAMYVCILFQSSICKNGVKDTVFFVRL